MPVRFIEEEKQAEQISSYNEGKPGYQKIPLVARNLNSGWPLLQVSLLTAVAASSETKYEPVLGGGKCHYFNTVQFMLASLIAKVPGKVVMTASGMYTAAAPVSRDKINANNIELFLSEFNFSHACGISLSSEHGAYGVKSKACLNGSENSELLHIINDANYFAFMSGKRPIADFGTYGTDGAKYTTDEINDVLNHDVAIFKDGQIFVDLGRLLDNEKNGEELKDFFNNLFKVDEFKGFSFKVAQKEQNTSLALGSHVEKITTQTNLAKILSNFNQLAATGNNSNLTKFFISIAALNNYGDEIGAATPKGFAIKTLATELTSKVINFYLEAQNSKPTKKEIIKFNNEFIRLLHSQDSIMKRHRNIYKPIILNILLAAVGVGLILIPLKALANLIYSKIKHEEVTLNGSLFFAKTKTSEKIDAVEACLLKANSLSRAAKSDVGYVVNAYR